MDPDTFKAAILSSFAEPSSTAKDESTTASFAGSMVVTLVSIAIGITTTIYLDN